MKGLMGGLSCWGYGYAANVLVNGIDIGIQGGKSEARRFFTENHEMAAEAPPEMRKKLFILKEGRNAISVEFSRAAGKKEDYLLISLELEGYPAPVFLLHSRSNPSGKAEAAFAIADKAPADFKPILITDQGEGKGAALHVGTQGCTVTPILNGKEATTLALMPGQVVLDDVKGGKNELVIRYSGEAGSELGFALITPEWFKTFVRKIKDDSEKEEKFEFNAK